MTSYLPLNRSIDLSINTSQNTTSLSSVYSAKLELSPYYQKIKEIEEKIAQAFATGQTEFKYLLPNWDREIVRLNLEQKYEIKTIENTCLIFSQRVANQTKNLSYTEMFKVQPHVMINYLMTKFENEQLDNCQGAHVVKINQIFNLIKTALELDLQEFFIDCRLDQNLIIHYLESIHPSKELVVQKKISFEADSEHSLIHVKFNAIPSLEQISKTDQSDLKRILKALNNEIDTLEKKHRNLLDLPQQMIVDKIGASKNFIILNEEFQLESSFLKNLKVLSNYNQKKFLKKTYYFLNVLKIKLIYQLESQETNHDLIRQLLKTFDFLTTSIHKGEFFSSVDLIEERSLKKFILKICGLDLRKVSVFKQNDKHSLTKIEVNKNAFNRFFLIPHVEWRFYSLEHTKINKYELCTHDSIIGDMTRFIETNCNFDTFKINGIDISTQDVEQNAKKYTLDSVTTKNLKKNFFKLFLEKIAGQAHLSASEIITAINDFVDSHEEIIKFYKDEKKAIELRAKLDEMLLFKVWLKTSFSTWAKNEDELRNACKDLYEKGDFKVRQDKSILTSYNIDFVDTANFSVKTTKTFLVFDKNSIDKKDKGFLKFCVSMDIETRAGNSKAYTTISSLDWITNDRKKIDKIAEILAKGNQTLKDITVHHVS